MRHGSIIFVPLAFALVITLAGLGYFFSTKSNSSYTDQLPVFSAPTLIPTPTSTPTPTPTPTPIPTPTAVPSPKPTVKPTLPPISGPPGTGLTRATVATPKGNFLATVMTFDMSSTRMITDTGNDNNCATGCVTMPLANYIARSGGFAGVNGTYFCPATYPDCASKTDSFDFPVYNSRLNKWINGDKLGWAERRAIFYTDGSGAHFQNNSAGFGGGLNAGIINYPGLVDGGNIQIDDNQSGLSEKQRAKGTKVGIGLRNSSTVMVVIASNVNMLEFAHVFKSLGATGALNLDTGGSTAAVYNGGYIYGPGRALPNAVVFARK